MAMLIHICEACGLTETLDSDKAFEAGWDYPPRMGVFGVISPRLCPSCVITTSLWWRCQDGTMTDAALTDKDRALIIRITNEPESITP